MIDAGKFRKQFCKSLSIHLLELFSHDIIANEIFSVISQIKILEPAFKLISFILFCSNMTIVTQAVRKALCDKIHIFS